MISPKLLLITQVTCLALMFVMAITHKYGIAPFKLAFPLFALTGLIATVVFLVAFVLMLIGLVKGSASFSTYIWPQALGLVPLLLLLSMVGASSLGVPKIHDISTRFEPPIEFESVQALRRTGDNSLAHSPAVQALQQAYYADLQGVTLQMSCEDAQLKAKGVAKNLGWQILGQGESWLEAVDTTKLLGFKDDIRVEVTSASEGGCEVHLRSASRVGLSDLGANAKRINAFLSLMAH